MQKYLQGLRHLKTASEVSLNSTFRWGRYKVREVPYGGCKLYPSPLQEQQELLTTESTNSPAYGQNFLPGC